jgi:Secretion system C-terminal sorting domain
MLLQKLKLLPDAFYTDSFSVKRVTNNQNGVVVATDITTYPTRTYTYPSIAVGKNGSALLCYTENNGFMRVSALSDSCKILWGTNGYALGTGYSNGNLYYAKYPTVTIGSNNKTALVTWQDTYRSGNTGENIYARNIDSLPNNLPECVNGLLPLPSITGASGVCAGQQLQLANAVPTGLWSSTSNSVSINAGTGLINATGAAVGNHTINYVVSGAVCSGTVSKTIYVSASPTINAISGSNSICNLNTATQYSVSSNTSGTWIVNNNLANITNSPINNYYTILNGLNSGFVNLSYTATNAAGCSKTVAKLISIAPVQINNITGANNVCVGSITQLQNATSNGVWSSVAGRANVSATGLVTGKSAGIATIKYTVTNASNCSAFTSHNIVVSAIPNVPSIQYAVGTQNPQKGAGGGFCNNRTFDVVGTPIGGVWTSNNNSVMTVTTLGTVATVGLGTATLAYTVSNNGCTNSRSIIGNVVGCASRGINGVTNEKQEIRNGFTLYPNPAKTFINLNVETLIGAGSIVVTDLYGKQVKSQSLSMGTNTVDVSRLSKGMYFVSMITSEGKTTKKLVVE